MIFKKTGELLVAELIEISRDEGRTLILTFLETPAALPEKSP